MNRLDIEVRLLSAILSNGGVNGHIDSVDDGEKNITVAKSYTDILINEKTLPEKKLPNLVDVIDYLEIETKQEEGVITCVYETIKKLGNFK